MKKIILSISLVFILASVTFAQNITGKLVDYNDKPLVGANVLLLSKVDSTYLAGTVSDKDGLFSIANRSDASMLMFSFIGYHSIYLPLEDDENIGTIKMQEDETMLEGVTIVGSRIINNAQGYSIRPTGSGLENCNTSQELFAFLPGISVSENKINLLDKLPVIYVNRIKINSQDELAALLPKNIENIEVDYLAIGEGATTKGGVIRITTKKQKDGGYSGSLGLKAGAMAAYGYNSSSPTFVFDASIGKWTLNYYAVNQHQRLIEDAKYNYLYDSGTQTNSISETRSRLNNFGNRLNISYEINDKSTLAISEYVGNVNIKNKQNSVVETILGNEKTPQESNTMIHGPESQFVQQTVAKYILATDDKGSKLEVTADYYHQNYHLKQFEDIDKIRTYTNSTQEKTNMFQFYPKYTLKFKGKKELKVGANYQFIRYNDETDRLSNDADAHIASAYANFTGMTKSLMYSAGLTLQYNRMDVQTATETTYFDDLYLCPQANLMWMINPQKGRMLGVMYQCSVSDMPYSVINSYKNFSTPYQYTTGNPDLVTPTTHEVMARFALNRHISMMLVYGHEINPIYYEHGVDTQNESITWSRPENGKYRRMLGARVEFTYNPTKWWNTKIQAAAMQDYFKSQTETMKGQWGGKFWWNNNFNFTSTFGGSLNAYWETATSFENYHWQPVGNVNASLWKSFCDDKLRVSLLSTIWAKGRKSRTEGDGYTSYYHNATKPTSFTLSLTWNFSGGKKVHQRAEAESIQQYNKIEEKK